MKPVPFHETIVLQCAPSILEAKIAITHVCIMILMNEGIAGDHHAVPKTLTKNQSLSETRCNSTAWWEDRNEIIPTVHVDPRLSEPRLSKPRLFKMRFLLNNYIHYLKNVTTLCT